MTKLCKDCVHFRRTWAWLLSPLRNQFAKCTASSRRVGEVELLISGYGKTSTLYYYCSTMREPFAECKPEGLLWRAKNQEQKQRAQRP